MLAYLAGRRGGASSSGPGWWAVLLSGLAGAMLGGGLSLLGSLLGAQRAARQQAALAGDVARRIRAAEREEQALLEMLAPVEEARDSLARWASRPEGGLPAVSEQVGKIVKVWKEQQRFLDPSSPIRDAYNEAQLGARRTEWSAAGTRASSRQPNANEEREQITRDLLAAVVAFENAIRARLYPADAS